MPMMGHFDYVAPRSAIKAHKASLLIPGGLPHKEKHGHMSHDDFFQNSAIKFSHLGPISYNFTTVASVESIFKGHEDC